MKTLSACEMMHPERGTGHRREDYPSPGSLARLAYDRLSAERGRTVFLGDLTIGRRTSALPAAIVALQDFYGLDVRRVKNCHYILAGEWFGSHYSDYVDAAIDAALAAKASAA